MAQEITVTGSLSCFKTGFMTSAVARAFTGLLFNMSGNLYVQNTMLVGITATLIPLGQVTAPHWAYFKNLDSVNFLTIRNGVSGADLIKLLAGEVAIVPLLDSSTPYAIANTQPVDMEYMIFSL